MRAEIRYSNPYEYEQSSLTALRFVSTSHWMGRFEDRLVDVVFDTFDGLPAKSKPVVLPTGVSSWTTLSGIVVSEGEMLSKHPYELIC